MAPEEALGEILQVPLGFVTPFALINESARYVSLLLDKRFKTLSSHDFDKFVNSIGRDPSYVDLEDNPPVGKDQPPYLAALVPLGSTIVPEPLENSAPSYGAVKVCVLADKKPSSATDCKAMTAASTKVPSEEKCSDAVCQPRPVFDAFLFVEEFLSKISALPFTEIMEKNVKQNSGNLGSEIADCIRKHLGSDLDNLAMTFKNRAYTAGFDAGVRSHPGGGCSL